MFAFRALGLGLMLFAAGSQLGATTILSEGFLDVTTLSADGWVVTNNSAPVGSSDWFQGNPAVFPAQGGPGDSYIAAGFNSASFGGDISNWLISPEFLVDNNVVVSFYTRTDSPQSFADRVEVRLSLNGASTDVGTTATSVGDFITVIQPINAALDVEGYPGSWTRYTVTLAVPDGATNGRIAFRYFVPNTELNGNYIGIDTLAIAAVPEPSSLGLIAAGLAALALRRTRRNRT
ncbi:choice-of-anchor J family PEP-CTERM protein [uncultured Paludibaculum sp.]|uniref:choice-of-anchor J family PEP-CTERM protein n=1 Tax=uncultured Paludibaculum sp. TaxID=1765020 RepID=UPI002AAA73EC|nr:choice-of-anchor J domain-containing protein [uncultured Paludibaculum sp.]